MDWLNWNDFLDWLANDGWLWLPAGLLLTYLLGLLIDGAHTSRRSHMLFSALGDGIRGTTHAQRPPNHRGFDADLIPPPDPYVRFVVEHHTSTVLNPLAWLFPATVERVEFLHLNARLPDPPTQELVWARRRTPPAALAAVAENQLWTLHHLDFIDAEYATRGVNPNGLRHAFAELHTRFGSKLEQITVFREDEWHVRVMVRTPALTATDVQTLIHLTRALGRAAGY